MTVSIVIVTRQLNPVVERLAERLVADAATVPGSEVLVVAERFELEQVAPTASLPSGALLVSIPARCGLAHNRNRAVEAACGDIIVFVDDDCWPVEGWFGHLLAPLADGDVSGVMGDVRIPRSTLLGDAISSLGFPAGGSLGFAVMFPVDAQGFTAHLSTLNCALRREVFTIVGGFDESMTFGGEDGELSHRIAQAGLKVRFQPTATVEHAARSDLSEFARWFFRRGRAAKQYARRAPAGNRIRQRLASYGRIIRLRARDRAIVVIVPLLAASIVLQQAGFMWESLRGTPDKGGSPS